MGYCTLTDVQNILPDNIILGDSLTTTNVNYLNSAATAMIEYSSSLIDNDLNAIYRIPLIKFKKPDFSASPITFEELYPDPLPLICARLTASFIYDQTAMARQEPDVSEWGKNQRALAEEDLSLIKSGVTILIGQVYTGMRFVRQELMNMPRVPRKYGESFPIPSRNAGQ